MAEALRQALGEHSAELARYSSASINKILALLRRSEVRVADELNVLLAALTPVERRMLTEGRFTVAGGGKIERLQLIKEQIQELASDYRGAMNDIIREDGRALIASEIAFSNSILANAVQVGSGISASQVYAAAIKNPFEGRLLREYTRGLEAGVRQTMLESIRIGFGIGEPTAETVRRLVGTKRAQYRDGSLTDRDGSPMTRSDGDLVRFKQEIARTVRTSYTHFSAQAYLASYEELGVDEVEFTATIDGRTTNFCASHDRKQYKIDDPKKPIIPAHYNCRSAWLAVLGGADEGFRPFVKSDKSVSELGRQVKQGKITAAERDSLIGRTSATNSFEDVLNNDKAFAKRYLGRTKYKLWEEGGLDFTKFSDPRGRDYSITELEAANQSLFRRLGLN